MNNTSEKLLVIDVAPKMDRFDEVIKYFAQQCAVFEAFGATRIQKLRTSGRCQTDSNKSQFAAKYRNLCRTNLAPLSKSGGTVEFEILSAVEGAFLIEMVADRGMNGGEFL